MKFLNSTGKFKVTVWFVSFFISFSCTGCLFLGAHSIRGYTEWGIWLLVGCYIVRKFILFITVRNWNKRVFFRQLEYIADANMSENKEIALKCTFIIAVASSVYWIAFYPGNMFVDTYYQFTQIFGWLPPGNWHCYGHTFFMKIIMQFTGEPAMIVWIQIVAVLYIMYLIFRELYALGFTAKFLYLFATLFSFSLSYGLQITNIWKDSLFSIAQLYTVFFLYKNYETKFIYMNRVAIGAIGMLGMLFFRHNGVLIGMIILVTIVIISGCRFRTVIFGCSVWAVFLLANLGLYSWGGGGAKCKGNFIFTDVTWNGGGRKRVW